MADNDKHESAVTQKKILRPLTWIRKQTPNNIKNKSSSLKSNVSML